MSERLVGDLTLEERYFQRMADSLGDKTRIFQHLPPVTDPTNPPHVLDVGAGGGEFADALTQLGYKVSALDANEDAVNRLQFRYRKLEVLHALANHAQDFGANKYDAVICSSILHEVFSYGDDVHKAGHLSSLRRALQSFHAALKPGGVLIIRDGVLPDNWNHPARVQIVDKTDIPAVHEYLKLCPFANGTAYDKQGHMVWLTETTNHWFAGNARSVMEFAYTFTWGIDSYPRETQELYGVLTLNGYKNMLTEQHYQVEQAYSYLQPGYPAHLEGKLVLEVDGQPAEWFPSNAIWVARKLEISSQRKRKET